MIKNLMHKITKRLHPWPLIKYDLKKNWKGFRTKAHGYGSSGNDIDCHGADHIHVYMTLKCQNSCSFCINRLVREPGKAINYREIKAPEWVDLLNCLVNLRELYFNGGEHFNLPYFPDVINALRGFNINIFSNSTPEGLKGH